MNNQSLIDSALRKERSTVPVDYWQALKELRLYDLRRKLQVSSDGFLVQVLSGALGGELVLEMTEDYWDPEGDLIQDWKIGTLGRRIGERTVVFDGRIAFANSSAAFEAGKKAADEAFAILSMWPTERVIILTPGMPNERMEFLEGLLAMFLNRWLGSSIAPENKENTLLTKVFNFAYVLDATIKGV